MSSWWHKTKEHHNFDIYCGCDTVQSYKMFVTQFEAKTSMLNYILYHLLYIVCQADAESKIYQTDKKIVVQCSQV